MLERPTVLAPVLDLVADVLAPDLVLTPVAPGLVPVPALPVVALDTEDLPLVGLRPALVTGPADTARSSTLVVQDVRSALTAERGRRRIRDVMRERSYLLWTMV